MQEQAYRNISYGLLPEVQNKTSGQVYQLRETTTLPAQHTWSNTPYSLFSEL